MANPFEVLKARLEATNDVLKRKKVGVTIYIRRDGFTLRAVLPSKDPKSKQNLQQWVPINLKAEIGNHKDCLLYTSPSPRDRLLSRMPSSA